MAQDFIVFGHRGAAGHEPENTLRSFRKVIELGAKWVELDVYAVEDELIVFHDERLERRTNGVGYVTQSSVEYLRSLDAGKGERIPFLREVLDEIGGKAGVNIELKGVDTAKPVAEIINEYVQKLGWCETSFLVSSFNHPELASFKKLMPQIRIGALVSHIPLNYTQCAEELGAYSINAAREFVSQDFVDDAHRRGLKFYVYTVNHPEDLARVKAMGADGVFSDFPELGHSIKS